MSFGIGWEDAGRTGNRHGGLAESPYNVYSTSDGYIAIICGGEQHWNNLLDAMQRGDLRDDPRFQSLKTRVAHIDVVDDLVSTFTRQFTKQDLFALLMKHRVPCAPVRTLKEVVNDPHLHQRGMLQWIEHPELGRIVVQASPMRYDGTPQLPHQPSRRLGEDNEGGLTARAGVGGGAGRPARFVGRRCRAALARGRHLMRGKYVIAGIGHTKFGRLPGRGTVSMNVEACRNALADAGIEKSAVDALFVKVPTSRYQSMYGQTLAEAMRLQPKVGGVWDQGGATNISMISFACMAIDAGQCDVAIVCLADDPKTGTRQAYEKAWGDDGAYGWFSVAAGYAMTMQRHMAEYGTRPEQFGEIAVAVRNHGASNPHALESVPLTLDKYMESPFIIEPLRRDDICLVSDGAAAVVVMSEKRARELGVKAPVKILGFGQGQTSYDVPLRPVLTETMAKASAQTAFKMAGLSPKDIDVAQIYDCYTIAVMMTLEDYGFCHKGEGGKWVEGGRVAAGGELPINTSGGLLSETGMPGMQLVREGGRQMRGASVNQGKDPKPCVVSTRGGIMTTLSPMILGH